MEDWELEFTDPTHMHSELERLRKKLANEMSKNAYLTVTGKSLNEVRADGIFDMLFALQDNGQEITVETIEKYASNLPN